MSDKKSKKAKKTEKELKKSVVKTLHSVVKDSDKITKDNGRDHISMVKKFYLAEKSSENLSRIWSDSPASALRFIPGQTNINDINAAERTGFSGTREEGQQFILLSSTSIARYQQLLFANGTKGAKRRLLLILQGMDASGKGGIVKHVFSQGDPMGMHYHGFGAPSEEELKHDFLWRIKKELPKNGWISIFDRSHYEDVVMPNVYKTIPENIWRERYKEINDFEQQLTDSGCSIIKIFLVSSKEKQKQHFLQRLEDPTKYWKFDPASDLKAREKWDDYMLAWQEVFEKTSTDYAPWYLVPADNRWYSRAVVSELLRITLRGMNLTWPAADYDIETARKRLETM